MSFITGMNLGLDTPGQKFRIGFNIDYKGIHFFSTVSNFCIFTYFGHGRQHAQSTRSGSLNAPMACMKIKTTPSGAM